MKKFQFSLTLVLLFHVLSKTNVYKILFLSISMLQNSNNIKCVDKCKTVCVVHILYRIFCKLHSTKAVLLLENKLCQCQFFIALYNSWHINIIIVFEFHGNDNQFILSHALCLWEKISIFINYFFSLKEWIWKR